MEVQIGTLSVELSRGDITAQDDLDAVVNAANAQLTTGGGVAGAIHRAAGTELDAECRPLAPIRPGQAVITGPGKMPNRHIIHCLGPVYGVDEPADSLLANCYERAIQLADEAGLESLGFPAISTGAFGYPIREAAPIAIDAVMRAGQAARSVRRIRFVLFSEGDLEVHREVLAKLGGE